MQTSGGYECYPNAPGCWGSMTSTIVPKGGSMTPDQTTLYLVLRKAAPTPGSGPMPRNSSFAFCPDDLARIRTWIMSGAPGPDASGDSGDVADAGSDQVKADGPMDAASE
jgi:hypothetical protein